MYVDNVFPTNNDGGSLQISGITAKDAENLMAALSGRLEATSICYSLKAISRAQLENNKRLKKEGL